MNFNDLLERLKQRWQETSQNRKVLVILVSTVVLAGLVYLAMTLTKPNYAILLGDLEPKDAGDIVAQLESEKIPYQLIDQGTTILVPQEQVDEIRVKLASDGLLTGVGNGFELFDKSKFGETDFEQQISYQRALQEELRRTITKVEGVEQARVHLVLPRKSVFIEEEGTASASVVVKLKPRAKLKAEQVKGLNDLIIGSVEGLQAENVHIIDTEGNVLNDFLKDSSGTPGNGFSGTILERQQQIRRTYEKELENRVQNMLAKVLGPNKAVAMVTAEMDFNQLQTNTTEVVPGQVVSERSIKEQGSDGSGGGVTGSTTQMPGQSIPAETSTSQNSYIKTDDTKNYQHGTRTQSEVQAPGKLIKLSTAVVLDESVKNLDRTQVEKIVTAAIGFDDQRGDQITVSAMTFDRSQYDLDQDLPDNSQKEKELFYMTIAAVVGGLLLLLLLVAYWLRRRRKNAEQELQVIEETTPMPIESVTTKEEEEEEEEAQWEIPPPKDKQKQLKELAQERPDDIASVLKVWLRE
ncbi:flagellar M-ring protein FliF [Desulforamulus reducens MI-1]|uniref:Flagellar M-ring protein n=1 Tax=Desulforamulus reducens (strain ATCC BAA-1160 / DSM 100696 / MI-1) TaxID=349161 RepID=A4J765_DESRM|nr:flagellar basal-body MS-ring/collar protein FliF [Desulforamulus reducens]ABO50918.1 flagellar M-ring protein FliF [Desulforamulus reducens MI-1]